MSRERTDSSRLRDQLYEDLIDFILRANPEDDLSREPIASRLEALEKTDRAEVVDRVRDGYSPLFLAARRGLPKIAVHLLDKCDANIEKKGVYDAERPRAIYHVTPLWCAALFGQYKVCERLIERGANINAVSSAGSTAIMRACAIPNLAVVKYLVDKGADVNQADDSGVTCLMSSVQSIELSQFLILNGANVNARDSQFETSLHHALRELRFGTVKLLLRHNADYLAQNKGGDDALQMACLKGCEEIANYLMDNFEFPPERIADAYELIGAIFFDNSQDIGKAVDYWKKAVEYRQKNNIEKDTSYPTHAVYMGLIPFRTAEEISALTVDLDQLRVHSLMIYERVLGKRHHRTNFRLLIAALRFADRLMYERCIDLWKYVLDNQMFEGSLFHREICETLTLLTNALFDRYEDMKGEENVACSSILNDVLLLLRKCIDSFPRFRAQVEEFPLERHIDWEYLLKIFVHLLHLAAILPKSEDEHSELECTVQLINRIAPTTIEGNSLLHLVAGCSTGIVGRQAIFPDPITTRLLLKTGAAVEATNQNGSTALHLASLSVNYREEIVKNLLGAGAHVDRPDHLGRRPHQMLKENQDCTINVTNLITLECLAATKVKSLKDKYGIQVPKRLIPLVEMH